LRMEEIRDLNENELGELWQLNQIPEESHHIFDAIGLDLQQFLRKLMEFHKLIG
jgi:hypothetical protein